MLGDLLQYNIFLCPNLGQDKKRLLFGTSKKGQKLLLG
jgi:hypothetical protein